MVTDISFPAAQGNSKDAGILLLGFKMDINSLHV